jgi:hypothetical protein
MCIICASYNQNEIRIIEAWGHFAEMKSSLSEEHSEEVQKWLLKEASRLNIGVHRLDKLKERVKCQT